MPRRNRPLPPRPPRHDCSRRPSLMSSPADPFLVRARLGSVHACRTTQPAATSPACGDEPPQQPGTADTTSRTARPAHSASARSATAARRRRPCRTPVLPMPPGRLLANAAAVDSPQAPSACRLERSGTAAVSPPAAARDSRHRVRDAPATGPRTRGGPVRAGAKQQRQRKLRASAQRAARRARVRRRTFAASFRPTWNWNISKRWAASRSTRSSPAKSQLRPPSSKPSLRHKGKVVAVHRDNVFVEIGGRQQGIVSLRNLRRAARARHHRRRGGQPLQRRRRPLRADAAGRRPSTSATGRKWPRAWWSKPA